MFPLKNLARKELINFDITVWIIHRLFSIAYLSQPLPTSSGSNYFTFAHVYSQILYQDVKQNYIFSQTLTEVWHAPTPVDIPKLYNQELTATQTAWGVWVVYMLASIPHTIRFTKTTPQRATNQTQSGGVT